MGRLKFKELATRKIKDTRNIVVSSASDETGKVVGYSIAQQLVTVEGEKETKTFLKNSLGIVSEDGLVNVYIAIKKSLSEIGIDTNMLDKLY